MLRYADSTVRWNQQAYGKPANELQFTIDRDTDGALGNQIYILGHFDLEDDQALVVDVNTGGAGYFIAPITNCWGTTNDIVHRTSSLNRAQSVPNADGSMTFVLAKHDPGVPNWLDTAGYPQGSLFGRWTYCDQYPETLTAAVVPFERIRANLPSTTPTISREERAETITQRQRAISRWLAGG